MPAAPPIVAGIGEILWDVFPDGERLGGAPTNFAGHCHQLGLNSYPVGCIGTDELGRRTRDQLTDRGLPLDAVQEDAVHPTGVVQVTLDDAGKPTYAIRENAAWDHLAFTPQLEQLAPTLKAVCFGVLAQRSETTRDTVQRFLQDNPRQHPAHPRRQPA